MCSTQFGDIVRDLAQQTPGEVLGLAQQTGEVLGAGMKTLEHTSAGVRI